MPFISLLTSKTIKLNNVHIYVLKKIKNKFKNICNKIKTFIIYNLY